jgi:hypothetical protein
MCDFVSKLSIELDISIYYWSCYLQDSLQDLVFFVIVSLLCFTVFMSLTPLFTHFAVPIACVLSIKYLLIKKKKKILLNYLPLAQNIIRPCFDNYMNSIRPKKKN